MSVKEKFVPCDETKEMLDWIVRKILECWSICRKKFVRPDLGSLILERLHVN